MTPDQLQAHARQLVADWPPVADDTYAQLALLLAPEQRPAGQAVADRPQPQQTAA